MLGPAGILFMPYCEMAGEDWIIKPGVFFVYVRHFGSGMEVEYADKIFRKRPYFTYCKHLPLPGNNFKINL
jgi:hypothetical protein